MSNEIIDFTTDENPTIRVVVLVYASLMFAALEPTTDQQPIREFAEQLWALAEAVQGFSQEHYNAAAAFVVDKGNALGKL